MKEFFKSIDWYVKGGFLISILMLVASFIIPPTGIIDPTVLTAVAEINGFGNLLFFLYKIPEYLEKGMSAKMQKGDISIEVANGKTHER